MRVNNFYSSWLTDLSADQLPDGMVPLLFPNIAGPVGGVAGWGDASTIVPWNMYLAYGDKRILESQYPSMKAWVGYMQAHSKDGLWNIGFPWWTYGDWLYYMGADPSWVGWGPPAPTDLYLIAQCFYGHSIQLVINAGKALGKTADVATYSELLQRVKLAFADEYVTHSGRLVSGTQTAYTLALHFDMLPDSLRKQAARRLVENITDYHDHFSTGELGAAYLCFALTRFGYVDSAYELLLQKSCPSWLYPITMGATTIWERWDSIKPDSTFANPAMNSFDIPQLGSIGDWLYREVAGIDTYIDGPGYKHIKIEPHIGNGLTNAQATLETYYGEVSSRWEEQGTELKLDISIPANTKATVYIPGEKFDSVFENGRKVSSRKDIHLAGTEDGYVVLELGSGRYHFMVSL